MKYCEQADVERVMQQVFSTTSSPTAVDVQAFIESASNYVVDFTGREWGRKLEQQEYQDGTNVGPRRHSIIVDHWPIIKVDLVEYWDGQVWKSNTTEAMPGDALAANNFTYIVYKNRGLILFNFLDLSGLRRYRVTYEWGYEQVPITVRDATAYLAAVLIMASVAKGAQAKFNQNGVQIQWARGWNYGQQEMMFIREANDRLGRLRDFMVA